MTLEERAKFWYSQANIASARPEWWQRAIIWALIGTRYDNKLATLRQRLKDARDTDAT